MLTSRRIPASTANVPSDVYKPRQRLPAAFGAIEHRLLAVVHARGDAARAAAASSRFDRVGALRARFDAAGVRDEHDRLRRCDRRRRCSRRDQPGDGARARRRCCSTRSRRPTSSPRPPASAGHASTRRCSVTPYANASIGVAGLDPQRAGEIGADHGLARRRASGPEMPVACASPPNCAGRGEVGLEQLRLGRGAHGRDSSTPPTHVVVVSASVPSTFGSCRFRRAGRRAAARRAEAVRRHDLVDGPELFVRGAPDRRVERVADDERARHDRGTEQRAEDHERGLARPAYGVAQREPPQHRLANQARTGTAATAARRRS